MICHPIQDFYSFEADEAPACAVVVWRRCPAANSVKALLNELEKGAAQLSL
jgi:hypothetical protein